MDNPSTATKEFLDKLESRADKAVVDAIDGRVKGIEAKLAEAITPEDDPAPEPEAQLRKGFFDDIMNFQVWGIPVGGAVLGGFIAVLATELIDGFMANQKPWQRGLVKLAVAGVAGKWGKRFLGDTGSKAVAILVAFDAIRDLTPIDSWAAQLSGKVSGVVSSAGLADKSNRRATTTATTATTTRNAGQSFYSQALGG